MLSLQTVTFHVKCDTTCSHHFTAVKKRQAHKHRVGGAVRRWSWHLDEVACNVPPCDVEASGQVGQGEALVHRTDVCDAVAGVDHHSGQQP